MLSRQGWKTQQRSGKVALGFAVLGVLGFTTYAQAQSTPLSIDAEQVTYADHVAQIITDNCVVCHREGGIGPMQLTNYEQVRPLCTPQIATHGGLSAHPHRLPAHRHRCFR